MARDSGDERPSSASRSCWSGSSSRASSGAGSRRSPAVRPSGPRSRVPSPSPRVLLLDEPLGLDQELRRSFLERLRDVATRLDLTLLHVTHDPEAAGFASGRLRLEGGHLLSDNPNRHEEAPRILVLAAAVWLGLVLSLRGRERRLATPTQWTSSAQCKACHEEVYAEWEDLAREVLDRRGRPGPERRLLEQDLHRPSRPAPRLRDRRRQSRPALLLTTGRGRRLHLLPPPPRRLHRRNDRQPERSLPSGGPP